MLVECFIDIHAICDKHFYQENFEVDHPPCASLKNVGIALNFMYRFLFLLENKTNKTDNVNRIKKLISIAHITYGLYYRTLSVASLRFRCKKFAYCVCVLVDQGVLSRRHVNV